jgi:hypothetical protein
MISCKGSYMQIETAKMLTASLAAATAIAIDNHSQIQFKNGQA